MFQVSFSYISKAAVAYSANHNGSEIEVEAKMSPTGKVDSLTATEISEPVNEELENLICDFIESEIANNPKVRQQWEIWDKAMNAED